MYKSIKLQDEYENGVEYRFRDGLRIFVLINHPSVYSRRWRHNIENVIGKPIRKMDAIILGHLNEYDPIHKDAVLWKNVRIYGQKFPDYQIQEEEFPKGFHVHVLARAYAGNIVRLSMMALNKESSHNFALKQIKKHTAATNRTNLYAINARDHIVQLGGAECSSNNNSAIGTCALKEDGSVYSSGHKCMGDKGGEPDMVAYDVVELLWQIFGSDEKP